ncbi:MAG: Gfo/Idh/MocA family oxidoreductase [Lentisphaerae bacterium]|jgi:predicted dehydrogenase|nr:Gfo/Idh/MocA family oxidoreductase [Lentisphaerota bacterium]MBT4816114.1 Gfo/Idh/MocA family oxidoreductase [Lentisphaerota bacterium]MBT5608638.1 Gfo/Idh/MocA family oxidoreductase [Lentisphaerota bacterium]MBT7057945.1 Gfo/Idh/MocA family oxidoreductase [Lentisphaerota bacterium]MBT7841608.1 Gfo/Idh/MocA family oxidoreductase [Lentisphaerota bacterium]
MANKGVGIVGCGNISGIYFKNLCTVFRNVDVVACSELIPERAEAKVEEYPGVEILSTEELVADPRIDIVVNLSTPPDHFPVAMQALEAGKSVYTEKPLALKREEGKQLLATAKGKGVLVGGAPDTFLGGGIQTCRKLIDDGWIGEPVAAQTFMLGHGHESWHPDPEFYYKAGGGPMFDMGPYYLTALVSLLGPVKRVTGSTRITFPERTITSEKKYGQKVEVEVPTHVTGIMDFAGGAIGTIVTSFDVWGSQTPFIEVFGTEGSLSVPNPNTFGGPIKIKRMGADEWSHLPLTHAHAENSRGLGVADMASALENGRSPRAGGELTYHVLDLMHAFHDASDSGTHVQVESTCERPAMLPIGLLDGAVDLG